MPRGQGASRCRILVVGDQAVLGPMFAQWTGNFCSRLDSAASVDEAVAKLKRKAYDAVLVEFAARNSNDVLPVEELRSARPDAKIILFVQQSTPAQVIEAIRSHAFSYFSAPYDADVVREMIHKAVSEKRWSHGIELLSADPGYLGLRLRCKQSTADRLVQFLKEIPIELPDDERVEVANAFREMLLNAIEHGGKMNAEEWVRVSRIRTHRTVVYYIQDPGEGFRRGALSHAAIANPEDPTAHVSVREGSGLRPGGFGMLIASRLVDEVIYNEQGNEVILIKYLD